MTVVKLLLMLQLFLDFMVYSRPDNAMTTTNQKQHDHKILFVMRTMYSVCLFQITSLNMPLMAYIVMQHIIIFLMFLLIYEYLRSHMMFRLPHHPEQTHKHKFTIVSLITLNAKLS